MRTIFLLAIGTSALGLAAFVALPSSGPAASGAATQPAPTIARNPERSAFFGDLHLHTTYSFDAYVLMGTRLNPEDAYRFARGDTVDYLGTPVRATAPLDFLAVTDHSENIGVFNQLDDPNSAFSKSEVGQIARKGGVAAFFEILQYTISGARKLPGDTKAVGASTWARIIAAANTHYQPGKFTTFVAYEWTSMIDGANLHRNVIFRGDSAPSPFTSIDSRNPVDLWSFLASIRGQGHEALAIPHNMNASNGLMYDWASVDGHLIDESYAQLRAVNEPLSEITQNKGTSETHPELSGSDEFANFELFDRLLIGNQKSKVHGSYWRDALGRGLVLQSKLGINPFKDGAVGASDLHGALAVSREDEYGGIGGANIGGGRQTREQVRQALGLDKPTGLLASLNPVILSSGTLTGAWADSNTREDIYAAFRRKETYATSGTRIKVRFFGGWQFDDQLVSRPDWVRRAYADGVPMGGDLPAARGSSPAFAIKAVKDPNSGNLDRVQIIKVWLENGRHRERVFDVVWSGNRRPGTATGKIPAIGNSVDLKTGKVGNGIGAAELATVWRDPAFRADQAAVYYVRVLEIPTPRWSTLQAIQFGLPLSKDVPATIQERAWTSPIWYTPARASPVT